jgi:hypothetical protein
MTSKELFEFQYTQGDQIVRIFAHGRFFTLGGVLKITEVAQFFGLLFAPVPVMYLILTNNWLGYILGDFLTHLVTLSTWNIFFECKSESSLDQRRNNCF